MGAKVLIFYGKLRKNKSKYFVRLVFFLNFAAINNLYNSLIFTAITVIATF